MGSENGMVKNIILGLIGGTAVSAIGACILIWLGRKF